jgi:urate oxidase
MTNESKTHKIKLKTTWGIVNKESGTNKKSEIQAVNVEGKKITDQETVAETFNEYFVAIPENVKRQRQNNFINDDNSSVDNHTYFMEQACNKPYPSMESKCSSTKEFE